MHHILRAQQFDRPSLERLFGETDEIIDLWNQPDGKARLRPSLPDRQLAVFFYEPSTRTYISFISAGQRLGMHVVSTNEAGAFSSAVKGETLEDTIRILCGYGVDVIVLRHKDNGAAERAAHVVDTNGYKASIVNAGDGTNQHPTQALLDLYTIRRELGRLDGLTVAIGGDLKNGRTAKSLAYLLSKFEGVKLAFIAPPELQMDPGVLAHLDEHGVPHSEGGSLEPLSSANVVYWTRVQTERGSASATKFVIGPEELRRLLPPKQAIIMHPLPRNAEISKEVDSDPRAAYFRQASNGMFIRMALLRGLCGDPQP